MHLIESGATAHVYRATNWEGAGDLGFLEGDFAVKVLRDDCERARDEAARELRALNRLANLGDESKFIVDFVTPLTEHDTKDYATELASALDCMRKANVLHGDLNPENIGLTASGHLRVIDFGTAQILDNDNSVKHNAGTLLYASPEALRRQQCAYAADWWALGVIVFDMLTGQHAFEADSSDKTVDNILHLRYAWPANPRRSASAMDFVECLLVVNQHFRMQTLHDCIEHPFMSDVDFAELTQESWLPLKFNFAKFEQERLAQGHTQQRFF
ncbi:Protein kinase, putative [Hondaea fermentalgiana]|uniref:non-specific serine/threonine protein kinase n=1 Tax=Hondaea fermentalgiana TaxID=2315210 RepID=A0A2R5GMX6_9STRA|nr:Protein kinase, putative [Hondaea fermentalgiana]|eukprot:GBG29983.1 Protein kinase, putative [Hondaea fermentalgiana]